ncbi:MAG: RHS repeat-associated core domain-containing protein, partial [Pirellulaceae bacterium]
VRIYVYLDELALVPFVIVEYESVDAAPEEGRRYYLFTNQVGAPVRVEDTARRAQWVTHVDPYGAVTRIDNSPFEMPLRFPGHYHDVETGLHYNRFRYYSPELGRYLQSDPAGQEGGIHVYAYPVNPLVGADLDGLRQPARGQRRGRATRSGPPGGNATCPRSRGTQGRQIVDQMIRDGKIVIQGNRRYQRAVKRDLYLIANTHTGRRTLNTIRNGPFPVTVRDWDPARPGNGCARGGPGACPPPQGTGRGAPSTVYYNPHDPTRTAGSPPDTALNHELAHAAHNSSGTNARHTPSPLGPRSNAEEDSTTANEDNGYRRERGLPERPNYLAPLP